MSLERFELTELRSKLRMPIDLFICSASYESRCASVAEQLKPEDFRAVIVTENENHAEFYNNAKSRLMQHFGDIAVLASLDTRNPLATADGLTAALAKFSDSPDFSVLLDITTFTRESLLILLALLRLRFASAKVRLVYVSAAEYSLNETDEDKWLSKGIADVRSVLGFSGMMLPSRRLHLIVLVGFEYDRAAELIRAYEPSFVTIGYDEPSEPGAEKHRAAQKHNFDRVRAMFANAHEFRFGCYDPLKTKQAVAEQVARLPDTNVVVAPMNTKLSTVGAGLAAMENETVQICYAQAMVYNYLNYSSPGSMCYLFELQ